MSQHMKQSPVFAAIEAHRAVIKEVQAIEVLVDELHLDGPAQDELYADPFRREEAALLAVLTATPTTKDEVVALLSHTASTSMDGDATVLIAASQGTPEAQEAVSQFPARLAKALRKMEGSR
jgi:hypothetical protein